MDKKESEFLKRLLVTFKAEAKDHINAISSGLLELEKTNTEERQLEIIENVFRESHSLKGAARAVNLVDVGLICQSLESVFAGLKHKKCSLSQSLFDVFYRTVDGLVTLTTETVQSVSENPWISKLINDLENALKGSESKKEALESGEKESRNWENKPEDKERPKKISDTTTVQTTETIRISTKKLHTLLLQAEEMLSAKLTSTHRAADIRGVRTMLDVWEHEYTKIQPEVQKIRKYLKIDKKIKGGGNGTDYIRSNNDKVHNGKYAQVGISDFSYQTNTPRDITANNKILEFIDSTYVHIKSLESRLTALIKLVDNDRRSVGGMVDNLLTDTKKLLMLPFDSLLEIFPRFVRDLSREQGKAVELVIQGGEIEIDRRILEEMKDTLIHLVRNCIDHGIEKTDERVRKKKPPQAKITINVFQKDSNKVEILISDDGAGIDAEKVKSSAVNLGVVSKEEAAALSEQEALALVFRSGVSTSPIITDISGRGLGLAIVREKVEKLGGMILLETRLNAGTTFRIILPLTLATFLGVLVRVDEYIFVIPTLNVERVVRIKRDEIKTAENRETIQLNGCVVSFVSLGGALELPYKVKKDENSEFISAVVLGSAERRIAFGVDKVLGEQEVLVKRLGKQLSRVRNISGATVLGSGKVVPIINVPDLMKSAVKVATTSGAAVVKTDEAEVKKISILVAEDSITSRILLKNILETAGYNVKVAVDGIDAFTILRTEEIDLVVSDVDMPRMNGFDLTEKIRNDPKLSELPVVLVTALESREDRERGIDVGASAYIVKSSFDQSNLLEVIKRLV